MKKRCSIVKEKLTRREFLRSTSGAAAVVTTPYYVPAMIFGANAPSNQITMGCIGVGNQGGRIDIPAFLRMDDVRILAVCDVNQSSHGYKNRSQYLGREVGRKMVNDYYAGKSRWGTYKGVDAYNDFRKIMSRDDIDAVLIVVPDHWHAVMTIMAANRGKTFIARSL